MNWVVLEFLMLLMAFAIFVFALEAGFRLGLRHQPRGDEPARSHANALHNAVLGLLALLLGFSFAMAVSRFETRKTFSVDQANAIGTAWLRAGTLPEAQSGPARRLLREYLESRLQYNAAVMNREALTAAETRGGNIENELWALGTAAVQAQPHSQPASLFLQALNDMFDLREKRRFALDDQVPTAVIVLLYAVAITAMALVAYTCGLDGHRRLKANWAFAFVIALVFIIILDIDRPRQGFVQVSEASLIRTRQSMGPAPAP